jgi:hypothetical protein
VHRGADAVAALDVQAPVHLTDRLRNVVEAGRAPPNSGRRRIADLPLQIGRYAATVVVHRETDISAGTATRGRRGHCRDLGRTRREGDASAIGCGSRRMQYQIEEDALELLQFARTIPGGPPRRTSRCNREPIMCVSLGIIRSRNRSTSMAPRETTRSRPGRVRRRATASARSMVRVSSIPSSRNHAKGTRLPAVLIAIKLSWAQIAATRRSRAARSRMRTVWRS